jgi:hypothetical protein
MMSAHAAAAPGTCGVKNRHCVGVGKLVVQEERSLMDLPGDDGGWDTQHTGQRFHPSCTEMLPLKKGCGKLPNTWV